MFQVATLKIVTCFSGVILDGLPFKYTLDASSGTSIQVIVKTIRITSVDLSLHDCCDSLG